MEVEMAVSIPPEGRQLIERSRAELPSTEHHFRIAEGAEGRVERIGSSQVHDDDGDDGFTTPLGAWKIVALALALWLIFAAMAGLTIAAVVWVAS
jgi:hypothetical protein